LDKTEKEGSHLNLDRPLFIQTSPLIQSFLAIVAASCTTSRLHRDPDPQKYSLRSTVTDLTLSVRTVFIIFRGVIPTPTFTEQGTLRLFPVVEDNIAQHWNRAVLKKLRLAAPRPDHPLNILAVSMADHRGRLAAKIAEPMCLLYRLERLPGCAIHYPLRRSVASLLLEVAPMYCVDSVLLCTCAYIQKGRIRIRISL